jgi:ribosomal protein S18 acetylase RimI-like enzyme
VRVCTRADLEPARWVVYRAYAQVLLDLYGAEAAGQYEVRSRRFMALYLDRDPNGSFVAEAPDGAVVGAAFCFAWGEVGWFGSLAVAPEWQGHGLGQLLTARAVDYLSERGCTRIGLETWPQSPLVQHLYQRFGFQSCRSTVKLSRAIVAASLPPRWRAQWSTKSHLEGLPAVLQALRQIVDAQANAAPGEPRPDFGAEVRAPIEAGWAEGFTVSGEDGAVEAAGLCYVRKPSGGHVSALDTRLLLVGPGERDAAAFDATLAALDVRAAALGVAGVTIDVNLRYARAMARLRQRGFRPIYELVRMERPTPGFDPLSRSRLIECARWAG